MDGVMLDLIGDPMTDQQIVGMVTRVERFLVITE